jgi:hypothetical protein
VKKIVVEKSAVFGTAAGVVGEDKGSLRPVRDTTAKVLIKNHPPK